MRAELRSAHACQVRRSFIAANDGSGHIFPVVFGHGTKEGTTFGAKSGLVSLICAQLGRLPPRGPCFTPQAH